MEQSPILYVENANNHGFVPELTFSNQSKPHTQHPDSSTVASDRTRAYTLSPNQTPSKQ